MRVLYSLEHHFERTPDGAVWTQVAYAAEFWERFLKVFDAVRVVARVEEIAEPLPGMVRADGRNISFVGLPNYVGPFQYLRRSFEIRSRARSAFEIGDAVILRVPSAIGTIFSTFLTSFRYPYAVQVAGDPYDVFAPGVVEHPLRIVWRWWFTRQLKQQCKNAIAAAYVTREYLQRRYPCPAFVTSFSDVELMEDAYVTMPRVPRTAGRFRMVTVASLAQMYKAPEIMIQAVGLCQTQGVNVELEIIGDGKYRPALEAQTQALGLQEYVHFQGQLTAGATVRAQLDQSDLFLLPSRVEGLPRAMVEAMARGLPCIGSTVGGIPELLETEDMVPPGDAEALARKICEVVQAPDRVSRMSERNLVRASAYRMEGLAAPQGEFHKVVKARTGAWLKRLR